MAKIDIAFDSDNWDTIQDTHEKVVSAGGPLGVTIEEHPMVFLSEGTDLILVQYSEDHTHILENVYHLSDKSITYRGYALKS